MSTVLRRHSMSISLLVKISSTLSSSQPILSAKSFQTPAMGSSASNMSSLVILRGAGGAGLGGIAGGSTGGGGGGGELVTGAYDGCNNWGG